MNDRSRRRSGISSVRPATRRWPRLPRQALVQEASAAYPPIADDATDLRQLKKAVEDAASISGGLWLSYLFVLFYLAVAAGAVTHVDLFFEKPVKLPFLNIELPLLAFFFLAPILFLLTHVYTLVHFVLLTDKAKRFHTELRRQVTAVADPSGDENKASEIRNSLRRQLPSNIFVQFLAGPDDLRDSLFGTLLKSVAWATLVVGPVLLLLLLQTQFLPYHSAFITWTHRVAILVELVSLWWLWRTILAGRGEIHRWRPWTAWVAPILGIALSCLIIVFSFVIAVFPGEAQETSASISSLRQIFLGKKSSSAAKRGTAYLSSTLILTGLNIFEGLNVDDPKKFDWRPFLFLAGGRDFRGAIFDLAVLTKINFENALLKDASFNGTKLDSASFEGADLQGASFVGADLQKVFFKNAQLQGASLARADLQDVSLDDTELRGAQFSRAQARGASFNRANLQGAEFVEARLEGAYFIGANIQGAVFIRAYLQGAALDYAMAEGTMFDEAHMQATSLDAADLRGASLSELDLEVASFDGADLEGANFYLAQLQGASFKLAKLDASAFPRASLWRTDFGTIDMPDSAVISFEEARWGSLVIDRNGPRAWANSDYEDVKRALKTVPPGVLRDAAFGRIERVNCQKQDKNLDTCDSDMRLPPEVAAQQARLEKAMPPNYRDYNAALAKSLQGLVCSDDDNAIFILRGLIQNHRLEWTGQGTPELVDSFLGKTCPISKLLNQSDKAALLKIKADSRSSAP